MPMQARPTPRHHNTKPGARTSARGVRRVRDRLTRFAALLGAWASDPAWQHAAFVTNDPAAWAALDAEAHAQVLAVAREAGLPDLPEQLLAFEASEFVRAAEVAWLEGDE